MSALIIERQEAFHKWNSSKDQRDWDYVELLDSYINDLSSVE